MIKTLLQTDSDYVYTFMRIIAGIIVFPYGMQKLLKRRAKTAKGSYLFPSEKHPDRPIGCVRKGHNAAIRRAAIKPHFVLYDLRHTFATRAVAAGVDLPTLSAMLGHTSITMTMRYVHPAAE